MGIQDRDWYAEPSRNTGIAGGLRTIGGWPLTYWIIAINLVVHVLSSMIVTTYQLPGGETRSVSTLHAWGHFSLTTAIYGGEVWRFITFQFLHAPGLMHVGFNMLGLYFFGRLVERELGTARYLAFYLLCGIGGPVLYVLLQWTGTLNYPPQTPLVGASAGLFGVLIAGSIIAPNMRVQLLLPPVELTMRQMAWVYIAIAAYVVIFQGPNAGGEAAHLGGAGVGYLLIKYPRLLRFADRIPLRNRPPKLRVRY